MRLLRLRIRNIASLRNEHEIDFQEIQKESPLFAITGETGAGKSTILNCIALALYGDVYKSNVYQPDVVTLGEKDASIELLFQVRGKTYLADWKIRVLKNNGEKYSKDPTATRLFYVVEGTDFDSPKTVTKTTAEELLNLDFKQFCKCIILNQGEFARFLTSSFNERKEILEKLYPGELLDSLSRELDQEKKALERSKHELEIELHTLRGDNIAGDELLNQKVKYTSDLAVLDQNLKDFEALSLHLTSLVHYFDKYQENERRKLLIREEIALETTKFNHLLKAGEALFENFRKQKEKEETEVPVLQTYLEKESTLRHIETGWIELTTKLKTLATHIDTLKDKLNLKETESRELSGKLSEKEKAFTHAPAALLAQKKNLEEIFDLTNEKEILHEEIKGKREKLQDLEARGLELKAELEKLDSSILPGDQILEAQEQSLLIEKQALQKKLDHQQRAKISAEELRKGISHLKLELEALSEKQKSLTVSVGQFAQEILPLEVTLKLEELSAAKDFCLDHALTSRLENCPVCESEVSGSHWQKLKAQVQKADLTLIKKNLEHKRTHLLRTQNELTSLEEKLLVSGELLKEKEVELQAFSEVLKEALPSLPELDEKIDQIRRRRLELNQLKKERDQKSSERERLRVLFKELREAVLARENVFAIKEARVQELALFAQDILLSPERDLLRELRRELELISVFQLEEAKLDKLKQETLHLAERMQEGISELSQLERLQAAELERMSELKAELLNALGDQKASALIQKLTDQRKAAELAWTTHSLEQNKQEQVLTNARGRLSSFEDHTKELELQYLKELHSVREAAAIEVKDEVATAVLKKLRFLDLGLSSPRELFLPLVEFVKKEKDDYRQKANYCRMQLAGVTEKYEAWEKLQDKIKLREMKLKELQTQLERKVRLFEVIGKDDLRTFVLSLVEESLIQQTNEELQKLCQGRYEIVHQTKSLRMTPEFFILDKFREGGRRKVSTLSGGETFMVAIAMALGLAEMTRGQAEIDSLFIDEGFGTLDQDSLEDVLDMLQQIQTRGLMVGIISHIKPLTEALPINLLLTKKSDGTSTIGLRHN